MSQEECRKLMVEFFAGTYRAKEIADGKETYFSFRDVTSLMQRAFVAGEEA